MASTQPNVSTSSSETQQADATALTNPSGTPTTSSTFQKPSTTAIITTTSNKQDISEISQHTVAELIQKWKKTMHEHRSKFKKASDRVIRWDNAIFEAQEQLSSTAAHVTRIENQQERIEAELSYITKSQKQIETDLQVVEAKIRNQPPTQTPAQVDRKETYLLAERIDRSLNAMEARLQTLAPKKAQDQAQNTTDEMQVLRSVFNHHNSTMAWIQQQVAEIDNRLRDLSARIPS